MPDGLIIIAGRLPDGLLLAVGAGIIAAGDELAAAAGQLLKGLLRRQASDAGGVVGRPHYQEIVVGKGHPLLAVAIGHKLKLAGLRMHRYHVHIATAAKFQGNAGAGRYYIQLNTVFILKHRLQVAPQAGIVEAGGGGHP